MSTPALISRQVLLCTAAAVTLLAVIGIAASSGLLLGNATTSVPRGLYRKAPPDAATYVTFCLGHRHAAADWYLRFCSPDAPDGPRILKRIGERRDGQLVVEGDGPFALDSRVLGPVSEDEIRGWWVPLVQASGNGR